MNLTRQYRISRISNYESGIGVEHPMITHGAGMVTIAAACTSAANALSLTLIMLVLCAAMSVVYMFERGEYIQPMRSMIYFVPSAIIACLCGLAVNWISEETARSIGMYIPILAADSLVLARLQADAPFLPPAQALPEALGLWWLYAVLALPIGVLREIIGHGTVFGHAFFISIGAQGTNLTFAGFIMLGFGLAIRRRLKS